MALKKWIVPKVDKQQAKLLSDELGIDPLVALIAASRGYTDPFELEEFLNEDIIIEDPFAMVGMREAVDRINIAIDNFEKIAIYGDYDCDGITATTLLYSYLSKRSADVCFYIPDRGCEGYGMNIDSIEKLHSMGAKLIITVDNGICAFDEIDYAGRLGIDVVVTDHHLPSDKLPNAAAVVDPHRADCPSSFKGLAGVGVAFKLICALDDTPPEELIYEYADLVTIGTVADIMPIIGENRSIVRVGLKILSETDRVGLVELVRACKLEGREITTGNVSFILAPRINAAGRMGHSGRVVHMLMEKDSESARSIACELCEENAERQKIEQDIVKEACSYIDQNGYNFDRVIVVSGENWHHGIVGIVASRLVERYGKPCIVLSIEGDTATGSGRSISGFSLFDAINNSASLTIKFGGHDLAAGLTIKAENIDKLRYEINKFASNFSMPFPTLKLDCKLNPAALSVKLADSITELEPFGSGNPAPVFGLFNMKIEKITPIGGGKHLRLSLSRGEALTDAVLFAVSEDMLPFFVGDMVDAAAALDINVYNGQRLLSVQIKSLRPAGIDEDSYFSEQRLYDSYRRNDINETDSSKVRPNRDEFAVVYRYILSKRAYRIDIEKLSSQLHSKMPYSKMRIALDVMKELGIINIKVDNGADIIEVNKIGGKVNLDDSKILKHLGSIANGVRSWVK